VDRITLSFDLVANDWLRARFPEVRVEIGDPPTPALWRPGPLGTGVGFVRSRFYPLRNRLRRLRFGAERT
jgi:hypothetical protein